MKLPTVLLWLGLAGLAAGQPETQRIPRNMFAVKPISHAPETPPGDLPIVRGRYFSYALPPNWKVGEDAPFALSMLAPDNQAFTVMVGNAGMFLNSSPERFMQNNLMAIRAQNIRFSQGQQVAPRPGFHR